MWDFLREHWWIAITVPYFGFNVWLVSIFIKDGDFLDRENDPLCIEVGVRAPLYLAGLPIILLSLAYALVMSLTVDHIKFMTKHVLVGVGVIAIHILATANLSYRLPYPVVIIELLSVWFLASYVLHTRGKS